MVGERESKAGVDIIVPARAAASHARAHAALRERGNRASLTTATTVDLGKADLESGVGGIHLTARLASRDITMRSTAFP